MCIQCQQFNRFNVVLAEKGNARIRWICVNGCGKLGFPPMSERARKSVDDVTRFWGKNHWPLDEVYLLTYDHYI